MKILLQTEVRTISDRELAENQAYLIGLFNRVSGLAGNLRSRLTSSNKAVVTCKTRTN